MDKQYFLLRILLIRYLINVLTNIIIRKILKNSIKWHQTWCILNKSVYFCNLAKMKKYQICVCPQSEKLMSPNWKIKVFIIFFKIISLRCSKKWHCSVSNDNFYKISKNNVIWISSFYFMAFKKIFTWLFSLDTWKFKWKTSR